MPKNNFSFFQNCDCEYFPCHKTNNPEDFNCLFCYCPLYALADKCGGNFVYIDQPDGTSIKDCSNCMVPHSRGGYMHVMTKYPQLAELANKRTKDDSNND